MEQSYCSNFPLNLSDECRRGTPYYLPKELGQVFVIVYIHPCANTKTVAGIIYDTVAKLDNIAPDVPKFIVGDFNGCSIKNVLPKIKR